MKKKIIQLFHSIHGWNCRLKAIAVALSDTNIWDGYATCLVTTAVAIGTGNSWWKRGDIYPELSQVCSQTWEAEPIYPLATHLLSTIMLGLGRGLWSCLPISYCWYVYTLCFLYSTVYTMDTVENTQKCRSYILEKISQK